MLENKISTCSIKYLTNIQKDAVASIHLICILWQKQQWLRPLCSVSPFCNIHLQAVFNMFNEPVFIWFSAVQKPKALNFWGEERPTSFSGPLCNIYLQTVLSRVEKPAVQCRSIHNLGLQVVLSLDSLDTERHGLYKICDKFYSHD